MAEQRQPFRFRLPWLSAPPPPPPLRPTPATATETVPVQQFLVRPTEIVQTEASKRAEQIEVASPPSSPIRPPTQFRAVFMSPMLSPRIPNEPDTNSASQPQSPRLSIEATSPRTVSLPSSPAILVQSMSQPQPPSDLYTNRKENQSPKLIAQLEEPKPIVSQQQLDTKAESKADTNSKVSPNEPSVKSNAVVISPKGEAKKEKRELEKEEKPEPVQKTITEHFTEGPKSHPKDLHGKSFPLNKEQNDGKKDKRKEKKHVKAHNSTNPNEKTSSREQPQESKEDPASPQRELREDISKFVHSLTTGVSSVEIPVNVVTLNGDNRGASMQIDSGSAKREESIHIHRGYKINPDESTEITSEETESSDERNKAPITEAEAEEPKTFINSNAQGINDSIVFDSSITERNPGVHLVLDSVEPSNEEKDKTETLEARKSEFTISKAEKHTYEPTIRRRCLRGLFMESSDSDEDGQEKPRRHGCRYCRDKELGEV